MAPGLSDLIPGLREAEDQYRSDNAEAFLGIENDIAGAVPILPFTPKMYIDLVAAGNAFFAPKGTPITAADVAVFLWRCHPNYCFGTEQANTLRRFFNGSLYLLDYSRAVDDINTYNAAAWAGMPMWKSRGVDVGVAQWPSRLVHLFAKEYGWTEEYILNLPFRRLWQYANRVLEENDPKFKETSPNSLRLRDEWLNEANKRLQAERAEAGKGRN